METNPNEKKSTVKMRLKEMKTLKQILKIEEKDQNLDKLIKKKTAFITNTDDQLREIINAGNAAERKKKYDKNVLKNENKKIVNYLHEYIKKFIKTETEEVYSDQDFKHVLKMPNESPRESEFHQPIKRKQESDNTLLMKKKKMETVKDYFNSEKKFNRFKIKENKIKEASFDNGFSFTDRSNSSSIMLINNSLRISDATNKDKTQTDVQVPVVNFSNLSLNSKNFDISTQDISSLLKKANENDKKTNIVNTPKKVEDGNNKNFKAKSPLNSFQISKISNSKVKNLDIYFDINNRPTENKQTGNDKKSITSKQFKFPELFSIGKVSDLKEQILGQLSSKKLPTNRFSDSNLSNLKLLQELRDRNYNSNNKLINEDSDGNSSSENNEIDEMRKVEIEKNKEEQRNLKKMTKVLSDSLSIEEEIFEIVEDSEPKFLIMPDTTYKLIWDVLLGVLTIYSLIFTPITLAFENNKNLFVILFDFIVDLLFMVDIFLNFFIPFHNFEENLVKQYKLIALNYLSGSFIWDFLAGIPIGSIMALINYMMESTSIGYRILSLNQAARFAKFYRVVKISQLLKLLRIINKRRKKFTNNNTFEEYNISSSIKRFFQFILGFLLITHIITCMWIFIGNTGDQNWIMKSGFTDQTKSELYVISVYFIWTTVFTIGYGDITPSSTLEKLFVILIMFIGILIYSFAVSSLGTILTNYDTMTVRYLKSLQLLDEIKRRYKVPEKFYFKVAKFLNYNFKFNKLEQFDFINELSPGLKNCLIKNMYDEVIKSFKFLKFDNEDFKSKVVLCLRPVRAFRKEYIIIENEYIEELVLVRRGVLSINLGHKYNESKIMEIRKSEHFGDILMMAQQKSPVHVKVASKIADLFYMSKNDLVEISLKFPEIFDKIYLISTYNYLIMLEHIEEKIEKIESENKKLELYFEREKVQSSKSPVKEKTFIFSNSTFENPNQNKNIQVVNAFKRNNKSKIDIAKKEIQKIYETRNKLQNLSFVNSINEKLQILSQADDEKYKENETQLNHHEENVENEKFNNEIIKNNLEITNKDNSGDHIDKAQTRINLVNFNVIIQNNNYLNESENPGSNSSRSIYSSNSNDLENYNKERDEATNKIMLNKKLDDKEEASLKKEFGNNVREELRTPSNHFTIEKIEFPQNLKKNNINSTKILRRTRGSYSRLFFKVEKEKRNRLKKKKTVEIKIERQDSFNLILGDLSPAKRHLSSEKHKSSILIPIKQYQNEDDLSKTRHISNEKHRNSIIPFKYEKSNDEFLKKGHLSKEKGLGSILGPIKHKKSGDNSPYVNRNSTIKKPQNLINIHKLSSALVFNIEEKMRMNNEQQKDPEQFFKRELKHILKNHYQTEMDEQVIKIAEALQPIFNKYTTEYKFEDLVSELLDFH